MNMIKSGYRYVIGVVVGMMSNGSFVRSVVYTIGHIVIASVCNVYITGAVIKLAITDAIIEPILNGVWYYVMDRVWVYYNLNKKR